MNKQKEEQFKMNVEWILCQYANGMYDSPKEYPFMSVEQCTAYVLSIVFNIKCDGAGTEITAKGICEDLKFIGKGRMIEIIKEIGLEEGVLLV